MAGGPTTPELVAAASGAGGLGIFAGAALSLDVLEQAVAAIGEVTFGVNFQLVAPGSGGDVDRVQAAIDPLRTQLGLPAGSRDVQAPEVSVDEQVALLPLARRARLDLRARRPVAIRRPRRARRGDGHHGRGGNAGRGRGRRLRDRARRRGGRASLDVRRLGRRAARRNARARAAGRGCGGGAGRGDGRDRRRPRGGGSPGAGRRRRTARHAVSPGARGGNGARLPQSGAPGGRDRHSRDDRVHRPPCAVDPQPVPRRDRRRRAPALAAPAAAASDLYRAALERGESDFHPLLAGQGLRGLRDGQPAAEIVAEVAEQAAATLRALAARS